jgi:DNA-binding NarL/FixJ family response regulator
LVAEAGDGGEAVERGLDESVDLAILDVSMPRMTGLQAALELSRRRPGPRELEVLKLIAEAHTSKEIAVLLVISVKTVERHRANILDLGMRDRIELTRYAIRRGLIEP